MSRTPKGSGDPAFIERLEKIVKKMGNRYALAMRASISPNSLQNYLEGGEPSRPILVKLAHEAGVSVDWLATGEGPEQANGWNAPPPGHRLVRFLDFSEQEATVLTLMRLMRNPSTKVVPQEWLPSRIVDQHASFAESSVFAIEAFEQEMQPEISEGDFLLIDESFRPFRSFRGKSYEKVRNGAIYLVARGDRLLIRRTIFNSRANTVELRKGSDSRKEQKPTVVRPDDKTFDVIGVVSWKAAPMPACRGSAEGSPVD